MAVGDASTPGGERSRLTKPSSTVDTEMSFAVTFSWSGTVVRHGLLHH